MKKSNLKKDYEIKEMKKEEIEKYLSENEGLERIIFEDSENESIIRRGKKGLFIIREISSEKKERRYLDRDIKISSRKSESGKFGIKLIYHRKKDSEKEYRIFISFKNEEGRLIRNRFRDDSIKEIESDEEKMISFYEGIKEKEIKDFLKKKSS